MQIQEQANPLQNESMAGFCYFYLQNDINRRCLLPIIQNKYQIIIKNKFALIKSIQKYTNPFDKNLQIYYAVPIDPRYALTKLQVIYKNSIVQGIVKKRQIIKAEYKQSKDKGDTVMMALQQKKDPSILKIKIGNIQPNQTVQIQFNIIGQLKCQIQKSWTLRIPSHIAPRYKTQNDLLIQCFLKLLGSVQSKVGKTYMNINNQWDFSIHLNCSQRLLSYNCGSHKLKVNKISDTEYKFEMNDKKLPQIDLQFTYSLQKPQNIFCTNGKKCAVLSFFVPAASISNFNNYKGQYIFLLDRSGSMQGKRIQQAIQALILFIMSLPENSYFNVISFGSNFDRLFPQSVKYTDQIIEQTIQKIQKFKADYGGTEIQAPLLDIIKKQKTMKQQYERNLILLTDGQVDNTQSVIQTIKEINQKLIGKTHMIGIGNGVSFNMIERGAQQGDGQHIFIMQQKQMKKQIIYLLQSITASRIKNFQIKYNKQLIDTSYPLIPKILKKGRQSTFYLKFKKQLTLQQCQSQKLILSYKDQENQNTHKQIQLSLQPKNWIQDLNKYQTYIQIYNLIRQNTKQGKQKAIQLSISQQVLCKQTGYMCKIRQNAIPNIPQSYLLYLKNSLQGVSSILEMKGKIYVKTLTGKIIQIQTSLNITVVDLKNIITKIETIPVNQQRLVFGGKQLQDERTLAEYNITIQSILYLLLRLRGGGQGILIKYQQKFTISRSYPQRHEKISALYPQIIQGLPHVKPSMIKLFSKNKLLDSQITFGQYADKGERVLQIQIHIPQYCISSNGLIKLMKISGYWIYNQQIIKDLGLQNQFNHWAQYYLNNGKQDKNIHMTKTIKIYLQKKYQIQKHQLAFVYKKINIYLKEQQQ